MSGPYKYYEAEEEAKLTDIKFDDERDEGGISSSNAGDSEEIDEMVEDDNYDQGDY